MITLLGFHDYKGGHVFIAKDEKCWQRVRDDEKEKWASPSNVTICECCTRGVPSVRKKMKELSLTHHNDGTNPPTEEEWGEVWKQVPSRGSN